MSELLYGFEPIRPENCITIETGSRLIDEWTPMKRNTWLVVYHFKRDILPPLYFAIAFTCFKLVLAI